MRSSADKSRLMEIFFPYATSRITELSGSNQRFVHYSSAGAAMEMIKNREVWFRKSSCMNDFMEAEHGFKCLKSSYDSNEGERLRLLLDKMFDGLSDEVKELFNGWLPEFRSGTWLCCMSEHLPSEDEHGRLSMWRAYGGVSGVAIVMNGKPFFTPNDALGAYTSPVAYLDSDGFHEIFVEIVLNVEKNFEFLKECGRNIVSNHMFSAFRYAVHCTKHPGFHEEREWRILHTPKIDLPSRLDRKIVNIGDIPQPIYKLKLQNAPELGLTGIEPAELIERVIIGPSAHPNAISEAFVDLLEEVGASDPRKRVLVSGIPLRR